MIIDATDLVVGRLCSFVAKKALLGEKIDIINCENAVVSGSRANVLEKFKHKRERTTVVRGPFISRMPDRLVRRMIRGMLPYKKEKGEKAFDRVMCYVGVPSEFNGKKFETLDSANLNKRDLVRFVTIQEICKEMGAKSQFWQSQNGPISQGAK